MTGRHEPGNGTFALLLVAWGAFLYFMIQCVVPWLTAR